MDNVKDIIQVAVFCVGITQMLKQLLDIKHKVLKVLLTVLVGFAGGVLLQFAPVWGFTTLLGVSVAVVFYDNVLKILEKLSRGLEQ